MNTTKVGVGVAIFRSFGENDVRVLLGKRKGSHGEGEWAFPGGSMEFGESFEQTALRELSEEIGSAIAIDDLFVCAVTNLDSYMPKHYIDIGMTCWWLSGEPQVMEPDKVENWEWFRIGELPSPLFDTVENTIRGYLSGTVRVFDCEEK